MMRDRAFLLGAGLLALAALAPAAVSAANLGAVLSYEKTAHGIAGRTATAEFAVEVWSPQIIRVRVTPQGVERHVGYALVYAGTREVRTVLILCVGIVALLSLLRRIWRPEAVPA